MKWLTKHTFSLFATVKEAVIKLGDPLYYLIQNNPIPTETKVTREDLLNHFKQLVTMRNLQIQCDILYKAKKIRGFCHLYDGQQAIAQGMEAALTFEDPLIGALWIHCQAYKRGWSVREIIAQMLGKGNGATKGNEGLCIITKNQPISMEEMIPVGAGLAFALKYLKKPNIVSVMYGDGDANQGQFYEAANMAKLLNLPVLFVCQNNNFGMGTSVERSSMNVNQYSRGDRVPGLRIEGNDVFEIREAFKWAKQYALKKGPLIIEILCYRYHGHSMSDPGVSYRQRAQVQEYRKTKDPILIMRNIGIKYNLATENELEQIENEQEEYVKQQVGLAEKDPQVSMSELTTNVYADNQKHYIRGKLYEQSIIPKGQKY